MTITSWERLSASKASSKGLSEYLDGDSTRYTSLPRVRDTSSLMTPFIAEFSIERASNLLVRSAVFTTTSQPARRRWGSFLMSFNSAQVVIEGLRSLMARTVSVVLWSAMGVASSAKTMANPAWRIFARSNTLVSAGCQR